MRASRLPWLAAGVVGACLLLAVGGSAEALQYDRARVESKRLAPLLTGQAVHWTARMAVLDLGALLVLGAGLELRGLRRAAAAALGLAAAATAATVHLAYDVAVYRGASGIASAWLVLLALDVASRSPGRAAKALALAALALFSGKLAFEAASGETLFAGPLPQGVRALPGVHLAGASVGCVVYGAVTLRARSRPPSRRRGSRPPPA